MKRILASLASAVAAILAFAGVPQKTQVQHPDWSRNAVIYEVNTRQYTPGGTFKAFRNEIPRLKELGVDILWFMPIHPISKVNRKGVLGSYYAVADYKAVNPEFGTLDDFRKVVDAAHAAGMKVIIDWVPNHTGCDNAWVGTHPEYYKLNEQGEMYGPFDWSDVYQLDYSNPGIRAAMLDAMKYWIREAKIDGFRCDVAGMVPVDFWDKTRLDLEATAGRPIFMLAEATEPELMSKAFDMDYNWPMKDLFSEIAATAGEYRFGDGTRTFPERHAADIDSLVRRQEKQYPADSYMMNMTTNHDLNSWEGTEFERLGKFAPAFAVISHTLPGMPLIYTGQETGMDRAFEFFEKDFAPHWTPRNEYFTFYQQLNAMKHNRRELDAGDKGGKIQFIKTATPDVIAYKRELDGKGTFVAANLGAEAVEFNACSCIKATKNRVDPITGVAMDVLPETLASGQYIIFTYDK